MKAFRGLKVIAILGGLTAIGLALANLPRLPVAGLAPSVVRADGGCSLASLNGPYAVEGEGTVVASLGPSFPTPPFPFGEASLAHFNGAGTFFGSATVNIGGVVLDSLPFTGTYTVNSDCTGNLTVNTTVGLTVHEAFVVIGGGKRGISTQTDPWAVVQRRVERLGD
jgi:hypothetical protein